MARIASVNYTAAGTQFQIPNADTDGYDRELDIAYAQKALEEHTHVPGRGLLVPAAGIAAQPCAHVFHTATQSIAGTGGATVLSFNSERYDTDNCHDNAVDNYRLTCRTAGKYRITVSVLWSANATGYRELKLLVNSVTPIGYSLIEPSSVTSTTQQLTVAWPFSVSDYVEAYVAQNTGASLSITVSDPNSPQFMWERISA